MQTLSIPTPFSSKILRGWLQRPMLIIGFLMTFFMVSAQIDPIVGTLQVATPAPSSWAKFADALSTATTPATVQLNLTLTQAEAGAQTVRLKMYIEKGNTLIATSTDNASFVLTPNQLEQISDVRLRPYFQLTNIQGLSQNQYEQQLEEGLYRLTFEVYHATSNTRLCAPISQSVFITLNSPPMLSQPSNGEQIPSSAANIAFQWSSLANSTTAMLDAAAYKLTLVEVPSGTTDVAALFNTTTPKFSETVTGKTFLSKSPLDLKPTSTGTGLETGKTYAWRVQAVKSGQADPAYRNNGNSNIFTFTYNNSTPCPPVTGLALEAKSSDAIAASWTASSTYYSYRLAYRVYTTDNRWEWIEKTTTNSALNLTGLEALKTYEVKVGGVCASGVISFSPILQATTLDTGKIKGLNCGDMPPFPDVGTPITNLVKDSVIMAGDFAVTLVEVTSTGLGKFRGVGWIKIPWMGDTKVKVTFEDLGVNTDKKVTSGFLQTVYDPNWGNILNVDGIFEGGTNVGIIRSGREMAEFILK